MSWWGWMISGGILLVAELTFVSAEFYLVFIGSAALVVGIIAALVPTLALWLQLALFAVVAVVSLVAFRRRVYVRLHRRAPSVQTGPVGGVITLHVSLGPGESCQAEHGGAYWTICNDSAAAIPSGARARIASVRGLTLLVRPLPA